LRPSPKVELVLRVARLRHHGAVADQEHPRLPRSHRRVGVRLGVPLTALLLATACSGSPPPTHEDLALRACNEALRERLDISEKQGPAQTQMIGRREYGWLVRGLSRDVAGGGARNYECRLDDAASGPPTLTWVRLCAAGESPWGCPAPAAS
jgi:hypothetical protein